MTLKQIEKLSKCQYGKHFLTRSYSIELLLYLLEFNQVEGIDDFLFKLNSTRPKLPAFLSYLSLLEFKGCIHKIESSSKRSKRTLILTPECEEAIRSYLN